MTLFCSECCETWPPPPEGPCGCPDTCKYQIEIISPKSFGPHPVNPCGINPLGGPLFWIDNEQGGDYLPSCGDNAFFSSQTLQVWETLEARITLFADFRSGPGGAYQTVAVAALQSQLLCLVASDSLTNGAGAGWYASLILNIAVFVCGNVGAADCDGVYSFTQVTRALVVKIADTCRNDNYLCRYTPTPEQSCGGNLRPKLFRPAMPLTITVSASGTSLGNWQSTTTNAPNNPSLVADCLEAVEAAFSAEIKVTERENCCDKTCGCLTSPEGLRATFKGKNFTVGTAGTITQGTDPLETWQHYVAGGVYVFQYDKTTADNSAAETVKVELYCDNDDEPGPPAERWYVLVTRACLYVDAGQIVTVTTKTIGYLLCESSLGCGPNAEGDPVPLGEVLEATTLPGYPLTERDGEPCPTCEPCNVPDNPQFQLSEICE